MSPSPGSRVRSRIVLALPILLLLVAARHRGVEHPTGWPLTAAPHDAFTFSQPELVTTRHLQLDLTVDFAMRRVRGTATLEIENLAGTDKLILDTYEMQIHNVVLDHSGEAASWTLDDPSDWGRALRIDIEPATRFVTIDYTSSANAPGLLWNTAEQSYGRQQPYLYTQNEPVSARSWIPIQDTPSVRMTYEATLRVPRGLLALMSASNNPKTANETGIYVFHMPYRIPSYLIALAVGRLEFHPFDDRSGVYAEPELLQDAAWDLQYIPSMMRAAEELAGPYPFHRYDVLLMPPTYIVGGMEHPMLNFINPFSVVTGNRPRVPEPSTLIAHELAHSWAGDSATLANWNDVWINEGITSYLTWRIIEKMSGVERAELGWFNDRRNFAAVAQGPPETTILHRVVGNPGSGFDATGYVKGSLFMRTLEDHVGRVEFDAFVRRYFRTFAFRWVDDQQFVALLRDIVLDRRPGLEEQIRLAEWLYSPGLPSNVSAPVSSVMYDRATERATAFTNGMPVSQLAPGTWSDGEITLFLQLVDAATLRSRMAEIDAALTLISRVTPPHTWLLHAIAAEYTPAMAAVERVLMRGGTNGAIVGLYSALNQTASGRERAREIFALARGRYHDAVEAQVATILGVTGSQKAA